MSAQDETDVVLAAVRAHARVLKLPTIARESDTLARQALADGQHPLAFLRAMLEAEVATRAEHATERRLHAARLPARKTLSQFDWRRAHGLERARIEDLARCAWIPAARNVVIVGPVGTGKTHVATALGIEAIKRGHHVLFYRASDLVRALTEARDARLLTRLQDRLRRASLLLLDELGFVPFERRAASSSSTCSPPATSVPRRSSRPTSPSASGTASSPTTSSPPRSSTASPSTPTSS
jgi:DNA replication protein DnaC